MKLLKKGIEHFLYFHTGTINIFLHVVGFSILGYSLYIQNRKLFAGSLLIIESGHIYNHVVGITPYDLRIHIIFWRVLLFSAYCLLMYTLFQNT